MTEILLYLSDLGYTLIVRAVEYMIIGTLTVFAALIKVFWDATYMMLTDFGITTMFQNVTLSISDEADWIFTQLRFYESLNVVINAYVLRFILSLIPFSPFK